MHDQAQSKTKHAFSILEKGESNSSSGSSRSWDAQEYRIPLSTGTLDFPDLDKTGPPPFMDADSHSPVFMGSAFMQSSVHPCKIGPHLEPPSACRVPYGGHEYAHHGRYDLLPFMRDRMEFVPTSHGRIPLGRQPVKGGFECAGQELYHAAAVVHGIKIPGKTGIHLGGCNVGYGGKEHQIKEDYEILCWKL
ncbi:hypothetical protein BGW80DRAFT_1563364 [Lactifluus volemus]|nr:hypothetical protein BGW80DRAFT_1563364 [Lactifluus volemus]